MTVKNRIMLIRLLEQKIQNPKYFQKLGIEISFNKK